MRKGWVTLLLLAIIIAGAYSLNKQINVFPTIVSTEVAVQSAEGGAEPVKEGVSAGEAEVSERPYGKLEQDLAAGFKERSERFTATYVGDKSELSEHMTSIIREALTYDDYSAYILESYLYTIRSWGSKSTITVEARYRESLEETAEVDRVVEEALAQLLKPGMNEHEKVKAIHDWIVTRVEYDQSLSYYTAYDAAVLGKAVCQGYSLLGYRMLEQAGIPVRIAEGTVDTGEHAWNMVRLDGQWYHLDLTWDDPVGAEDDRIRYTYYLKTDEELRADHSWTRTYPEASVSYADTLAGLAAEDAGEADRFAKLKLSLGLHWLDAEHTVTDGSALKAKIQSAVRARTTHLAFRYKQGDDFPEQLKAAFKDVGAAVGYRASYEKYGSDNSLLVNVHLNYP